MNLELQLATEATEATGLPAQADFERWAGAALEDEPRRGLVIRLVDEAESRQLNRDYRGRDKPTNVLSFLFEAPPGVPSEHLGDLVICAPVVAREALEQGKSPAHHWAHMVVHGVLHLLGHDHDRADRAEAMETLEIAALSRLVPSVTKGGD